MSLPQFTDIISLSNTEISEALIETENELFNLRFKKATRQSFKSHEIKHKKSNFKESLKKNNINFKSKIFGKKLIHKMINFYLNGK